MQTVRDRDAHRAALSRPVTSSLPVIVAALVLAWAVSSAQTVSGSANMVGVGKPSGDPAFPTVDPVSGLPTDWIAAVCEPNVYQTRVGLAQIPAAGLVYLRPNVSFQRGSSTYSAECRAREATASDPHLLVAEYTSEDLMQADLADDGISWYCFAAHAGRLLVIATRADEAVVGTQGLGESPVLQPLTRYGFSVYSDPGQ